MKRPTCRRTAGWLGAFLAALVMTGCAGWPAAPPPSAERMMWSTYPLFSRHVLGTCFLIAVRDRTGSYRPVVVTSAHVLEAAGSEPLQIPLRLIGRDGRLAFRLVEVGGPSCRKPFFVSHPAWDVAAFPLPLPSGFGPEEALVFLEERDLEVAGPQVGADVSFLGYPEGMPGTPDLFPVLRGGRVA